MDQQAFIALLNEDLESEYRSIVQYVQHTATIKGAAYLSIVAELKQHLDQELTHATTLAEQMINLSANTVRDLIRRLLPTFEIPTERLQLFLRQDRDAGRDGHAD